MVDITALVEFDQRVCILFCVGLIWRVINLFRTSLVNLHVSVLWQGLLNIDSFVELCVARMHAPSVMLDKLLGHFLEYFYRLKEMLSLQTAETESPDYRLSKSKGHQSAHKLYLPHHTQCFTVNVEPFSQRWPNIKSTGSAQLGHGDESAMISSAGKCTLL